MKKSFLLASVCVVLGLAQSAFAQYKWIKGTVQNNTFEDGVFGAIASASCTLSAYGTPSWTSPGSFPISRSSGQAATWGYSNGTSGSASAGGYVSNYELGNVSFRNVIRGSNYTGTVHSGFNALVRFSSTTSFNLTVWGKNQLSAYGVSGAEDYRIVVKNSTSGYVLWDVGSAAGGNEFNYSGLSSGSVYEYDVTVTADDANEIGSVLVNWQT